MSRIKQIRDDKATAFGAMKALRDKMAGQTGDELAASRKEFSALEAKFDALTEDEKAEERMLDRERAFTAAKPDADQAAQVRAAAPLASVRERAEDDPTRGFRNVSDFAMSVRNACAPGGRADSRLQTLGRINAAPAGYMSEAGGSAGEGYEVPAEFRNRLYELAFPENDLLSRVNPEPTGSNSVELEADVTTPWGATGVQAYWRGQGQQMTASKAVKNPRTVKLQELYAFVLAEEELLADAPRLNARLTTKSAAAIRWKAHEALINGTGTGMPLGWRAGSAHVTVAKETGQAADTIVAANVLKMYSRLLADGGSPFWLANRDTLPQIAVMTIGDQPIWTPPMSGMKEAPNGMLLGLPIEFSEHAETVGDAGDLQLINPVGYYAAIKSGEGQGIKFAVSMHLYFDYAIQAFRWIFRLGGQPILSAPVDPAKGTNTKSHFVQLAARA